MGADDAHVEVFGALEQWRESGGRRDRLVPLRLQRITGEVQLLLPVGCVSVAATQVQLLASLFGLGFRLLQGCVLRNFVGRVGILPGFSYRLGGFCLFGRFSD